MTSPTRPDRPDVVLHAEGLQVTLRSVPVERVRVRRRVTTHTRQVEVTVRREELEIERLPLEAGADGRTGTSAGSVLEVVLREEVPVVTTRTRAYEKVIVTVGQVTGEEPVTAALRHEEVELSGQLPTGR